LFDFLALTEKNSPFLRISKKTQVAYVTLRFFCDFWHIFVEVRCAALSLEHTHTHAQTDSAVVILMIICAFHTRRYRDIGTVADTTVVSRFLKTLQETEKTYLKNQQKSPGNKSYIKNFAKI